MRKYSKISPQFWTDPDVRKLSNDGKLFLLYLLTSPHQNMVGWHFLNKYYMSGDTGYPIDTVSELLQSLINKGFIHYDWDNEMLLIHKFLKYNSVAGPKQAEGAIKVVYNLPDHSMIQLFRDCVEKYNKDDDKHLLKGIDRVYDTVCDRDGGEQEPEPETEPETETDDPANSSGKEPEDSSSFEDPMGYLPKEEGEDKIVDTVLEAYKRIYDKPGYKLNSKVRSRILNRHREYKERTPDGYETSVIYVLEKAKRAGDNGDQFYKKNCALNQLVSSGMFENIFENTEDTREVPEGFFKHTDGRILPNDHFKEKKG